MNVRNYLGPKWLALGAHPTMSLAHQSMMRYQPDGFLPSTSQRTNIQSSIPDGILSQDFAQKRDQPPGIHFQKTGEDVGIKTSPLLSQNTTDLSRNMAVKIETVETASPKNLVVNNNNEGKKNRKRRRKPTWTDLAATTYDEHKGAFWFGLVAICIVIGCWLMMYVHYNCWVWQTSPLVAGLTERASHGRSIPLLTCTRDQS